MRIIIIVAVATNGVIGKANGEMPWHVKEDFQHFKKQQWVRLLLWVEKVSNRWENL